MNEYQWKDVSVVGFDELMRALDRADRKGYMPDAIKEQWEAFNWKPAKQEPVDWEAVAADQAMTIAMMKAEQEAAVLAEREACAQVCDDRDMGDCNREDMEARACAAAIRERSNP